MDALLAVASAIERLDVPFFVAGSFASNAYGFYRATADVDLVADLKIIGPPNCGSPTSWTARWQIAD